MTDQAAIDELKHIREETADERWNAHSQWEVRHYGYVCSYEEDWKKRFIEAGTNRPDFPPKFVPPAENPDSAANLAFRKAEEDLKRLKARA
jgi:hypothetical protein